MFVVFMAWSRKTAIIGPSGGFSPASEGGTEPGRDPARAPDSAAPGGEPGVGSGGDVRDQLPLQHEDLVLEHQFSLLESLELQFVVEGIEFEGFDCAVEVTVLEV